MIIPSKKPLNQYPAKTGCVTADSMVSNNWDMPILVKNTMFDAYVFTSVFLIFTYLIKSSLISAYPRENVKMHVCMQIVTKNIMSNNDYTTGNRIAIIGFADLNKGERIKLLAQIMSELDENSSDELYIYQSKFAAIQAIALGRVDSVLEV